MRKFLPLILLVTIGLAAVSYTKMTHVAITNSLVDSTPIGATTPSTGAFTTTTVTEGAAPGHGYSFNETGADTGMFSPSDNVMGLYAANVEYLHLDGSTPANNTFTGTASKATALVATSLCTGNTQSMGISTTGTPTCNASTEWASVAPGCGTAATSFSTCTNTMSWPVAFSDTTYKVTCSGINANDARASINSIVKTTTGVTVTTVTNGSNAVAFGEIDCSAHI